MLGGGRGRRDRRSPRRRPLLLAGHEVGLLVDQEALGSDDQAEVVVPQPAGDTSRRPAGQRSRPFEARVERCSRRVTARGDRLEPIPQALASGLGLQGPPWLGLVLAVLALAPLTILSTPCTWPFMSTRAGVIRARRRSFRSRTLMMVYASFMTRPIAFDMRSQSRVSTANCLRPAVVRR